MSSDSNANSWTILPPEETFAETLKPLTSESDHKEETDASAAGSEENNQAVNGKVADRLPVEENLVSDLGKDQLNSEPIVVSDGLPPSALESSGGSVNTNEVPLDASTKLKEDLCSSSDSYTLLTPSNEDLSTEAPGGVEFVQAEDTPVQSQYQEAEESDELLKTADLGKQADLSLGSEVGEKKTEKIADDEPEVRKRKSILAALEEIGRKEEDDVEEEEFQPRQQEDDSGFTVNKCILGAVILLGLGTIFFSGVFMDLDEESDYETRELRETGKQEWPNPEAPPHQADAENSELLNKLNKGDEQISVLQAQLQAQTEELLDAQQHAAGGAKEWLQMEELKKENSRLKSEMASYSALQEENQRMKKEMESVPTLQKELETLRSTLNELKLSSAVVQPTPSPGSDDPQHGSQGRAGHTEGQAFVPDEKGRKDPKREKYDKGEKRERNERGRSERKEGEIRSESKRDWKRDEQKLYTKNDKQKKPSDEAKEWKDKDWKDRENKHRQEDERKLWKNKEGNKDKEWTGKRGKTDWEGENEKKKVKQEKDNVGKRRTGKEDKIDWKKGKDQLETHKKNENWKGEKEWRKVKDGSKETGKEKREWKEKGEKNKSKKDTEWMTRNDKNQGDAGKERGQRKQWEGENEKVNTWKEERNQKNEQKWKNKKDQHEKEWKEWKNKDWKKEGSKEKSSNRDQRKDGSHSEKQAFTSNAHHKDQHKPPPRHHKPTMAQPEYWLHQRARLHHNPRPPPQCDTTEACAQAETLQPVPLPQFEEILQNYLAKAVQAGVDSSKTEELRKLTTDFFKDGMFVHDKMSFQEFVKDVGDILEDLVEEDEEGEDSALEDEMEGFQKEIMKKFSLPGGREKRMKGEWKKEKVQE